MAAPSAKETIVVVTGGDPVAVDHRRHVPDGALVIAADSGIEHAHALGLRVDVAVGDFDSVDPTALRRAEADGADIERHPAAKDATDLELALDAARQRGARRVVVFGGHGGRLDHLLGNALVLAGPATRGMELVAHMGRATVTVVRGEADITGRVGEVVSLLAAHGPAHGVTTRGLLYPLDGEDLHPGSTRGISNELVERPARVHVSDGTLLVVQPGTLGTHHLTREDP